MKRNLQKRKLILTTLLIITVTFYLSKYWIQFTLIQGDSMLPTYHNWQFVLVNKHITDLEYGDVIVFNNKHLKATLVKRIIALPGDTVQIKNGILFVNNQPSTLTFGTAKLSYSGIASSPLYLLDQEYFVLGDNYEQSKDSRHPEIGCVKKDSIVGIVID